MMKNLKLYISCTLFFALSATQTQGSSITPTCLQGQGQACGNPFRFNTTTQVTAATGECVEITNTCEVGGVQQEAVFFPWNTPTEAARNDTKRPACIILAPCGGAAAAAGVCSTTTVNGCDAGTSTDLSDTATTHEWSCVGTVSTDLCSVGIAACGTYHLAGNASEPVGAQACVPNSGVTYRRLPTSGPPPYNWRCTSMNTSVDCTSEANVNGVCSTNTYNGCSTGSFSDISDTATTHKWQCLGSGTGSDAVCSISLAECGTYNGTSQPNVCAGSDSGGSCVNRAGISRANCVEGVSETWDCIVTGYDDAPKAACSTLGAGTCGTLQNSGEATPPDEAGSNYCSAGTTAHIEDQDGYVTWSCSGTSCTSGGRAACGPSSGSNCDGGPDPDQLCAIGNIPSLVGEKVNIANGPGLQGYAYYFWKCKSPDPNLGDIGCECEGLRPLVWRGTGWNTTSASIDPAWQKFDSRPSGRSCTAENDVAFWVSGELAYEFACVRSDATFPIKPECNAVGIKGECPSGPGNYCDVGAITGVVSDAGGNYVWACKAIGSDVKTACQCKTSGGGSFAWNGPATGTCRPTGAMEECVRQTAYRCEEGGTPHQAVGGCIDSLGYPPSGGGKLVVVVPDGYWADKPGLLCTGQSQNCVLYEQPVSCSKKDPPCLEKGI